MALVAVLQITAVTAAYGAVVREPYIQLLTSTSATIVWRTDASSAADSKVDFGTSATGRNQISTGSASVPPSNHDVLDHVVTLAGLAPNTKYFYDFGSVTQGVTGGGTEDYYFRTAPPPGTKQRFVTWFVGDSGNGSDNQRAVRDAMLAATVASPPDLFLHCGDLAYEDGTDSEITQKFFAPYQMILRRTALWPTPGNHEMQSSNPITQTGPYYEAFVVPTHAEAGGVASGTEAFYSFDYANVHFISLESTIASVDAGSPMVTWLVADLTASSQDWTIVVFHHPPYTKGSHDSDNPADSEGRMIAMREKVAPILEQAGVDLVLAGHSHVYERSYLIDGAYGFGTAPSFATPSFDTLVAAGVVLDQGDGVPSGDGPYFKDAGRIAHGGTVYTVVGHGGRGGHLQSLHPVMFTGADKLGSGLMQVDGNVLTFRNLLATGETGDTFSIVKAAPTTTLPTTTTTLASVRCGNGVVESGEECDDGDTEWAAGSSCDASCKELGCGDPNDSGSISATDALFILRTAVGLSSCDPCVCDVDDSGGAEPIDTTDALRSLERSSPSCPVCAN